MSEPTKDSRWSAPGGAVSWMTRNPVAANLLMLLVFLGIHRAAAGRGARVTAP